MGKSLIIKGADFTVNAIEVENYIDISENLQHTENSRFYMHYPSNNQIFSFCYVASVSYRNIYYIDVSAYKGKEIAYLTNTTPNIPTNEYYFNCFASAINVSMPWNGTNALLNDAVDSTLEWQFKTPIDTANPAHTTYVKTIVPTDANWLILTVDNRIVSNPRVLVKEVL